MSQPNAEPLPVLAMFPQNARWVVAGRKTSTLRSKIIPAGRYVMRIGGKPYAEVDVQPMDEKLYWPQIPLQHNNIARMEGFETVAEFEAALSKLKIHGNYWLRPFLEGAKPLYLHLLSNPTLIPKEQTHAE